MRLRALCISEPEKMYLTVFKNLSVPNSYECELDQRWQASGLNILTLPGHSYW